MTTVSAQVPAPSADAGTCSTRSAWASIHWRELAKLGTLVAFFVLAYFLPVGRERFDGAILESLHMTRDYARDHVLLCLVPALFIAGAIGVFVRQAAVMKYLGPKAPKPLAYGVASVSGSILAVCSCTVLPLFAGIWRMGAGLGPASAFLYSGPAINVLAIVLTARVLGFEIGLARAIGAIVFSIVIGLLMHLIYRREETAKAASAVAMPDEPNARPLWQTIVYFGLMVAILVFSNWGRPAEPDGVWAMIYTWRWIITAAAAGLLAIVLVAWFDVPWWKMLTSAAIVAAAAFALPGWPVIAFTAGLVLLSVSLASSSGQTREWLGATWGFAKQIVPLLLIGVVIAGLLLGRPGHEGLIPSQWVASAVGGNSLAANFFAAFAGAFMYFATLTEIPILQGLLGSGMGKGPALALLLAGPALSLPNMLVLRSIMGTRKTAVYVSLVVAMATISGLLYGWLA